MKPVLVIMAAGMGSRFGGLVDDAGHILMDYSIFDAMRAGFGRVVLIIKPELEADFTNLILSRLGGEVQVDFAYQTQDRLPEGFTVPEGRVKPWGTAHAILVAEQVIGDAPFAVINADDYYGTSAFKTMVDHLEKLSPEKHACMVGYYLKNTVSEHGHVTRGVCGVDENGHLTSVTETYKIQPFPDGTIRDTEKDPNGVILDPESLVSMNFFGFTPWLFEKAEERFTAFLKSLSPTELKAEYVLPVLVDQLMHEDGLKVDVLSTDAVWFGVTYHEDKPYVQAELKKMHEDGTYPEKLF